jgi:arginine/lysine/ornithine decarboxylase
MSPREAYLSRTEVTPVEAAAGRICAEIKSPCPPCVPIVMPGERITGETAEIMKRYGIDALKTIV